MVKMSRKLISLLILFIFLPDSLGLGHLSSMFLPEYHSLRPIAAKNSESVSNDSQKIIIDTKELGLKKNQIITVQEMLERFAKKHHDILKDPESVLIVMRQQDARLTFKLDFNNKKEHPVKKGETYRVAYMHKRLVIDKKLPVPRGIWVNLGGLTIQEKELFEKVLGVIGKFRRRLRFYSGYLAEKWIEKMEAEGVSKLEFAKKLLIYYYREFDYKPSRYNEDAAGLYITLNILLHDEEVEKFISQLIKTYYAGGEEAMVESTHYGGDKVFVNDFDFLLSLFIKRDDSDIHSIAIHAVMEAAGFSKDYFGTVLDMNESRLPLFAQNMLYTDKTDLSRSILLRLLQHDRGEKFFSEASAETKKDFLKDPFMQNLVREMFRLDTFDKRKTETSIGAFKQLHTMDRLARVIYTVGKTAVFDFMDMAMREEDRDIAEKMCYFLDRLGHLQYVKYGGEYELSISEELTPEISRKWIDVIIHLAKRHKIFMKQTYYIKGLIKEALDYKVSDLENALMPMLEDAKRNDIGFMLDILSLYRFDSVEKIIISKYLKKSSKHLWDALKYLYRLKNPKSFEDVWKFLAKLESFKGDIKTKTLTGIGRYFIAMLNLKEDEGLNSEQKQRIREFAEKHILNQSLLDLLNKLSDEKYSGDLSNESLPDESSDYTEKISFIRAWLSLAGYFQRDDRYEEIRQAAEKSLIFKNLLDVVLEALMSLSSDESYEYLKIFAISILLEKKERGETVIDPFKNRQIEPKETVYETLRKDIPSVHPKRKRKLFIDMIDLAILNQSKEVFDELLHIFISADPKGALDTLNPGAPNTFKPGKWFDVDLSNVDPDPLASTKISQVADKIYSFKGLREFFLLWYFAYIKKPKLVKKLRLIDNKESFWERVRFGIRILLLIELGLIGDEEEREQLKIEFLIDSAFKHSGFRALMRTEERLSALVALKPVVDIMNMDIEMPKRREDFKDHIWKNLVAHDPTFYKTLEKQMKVYLDWLIKERVLTRDHKMVLDRFGAYFLKKKPSRYQELKLCDYEKAEGKMEKFEEFLRTEVLQFFYPEEEKAENPYDFSRQLMYTLVSILSKHEQKRKDSSVDIEAEPIWPMFLLPESAIIVRVTDTGSDFFLHESDEEAISYLGLSPRGLLETVESDIYKAIDSAA